MNTRIYVNIYLLEVRTTETYERIRQIRQENNLSQSEFAEKLGVTRSVISNIELNKLAKPEQKTSLIKLISREFNINEEWVLNGTGEKELLPIDDERLTKALAEISLSGNEKLKSLVERMIELDDKYIDIILNLVDTVLEDKK
ncbi:MAG: transcriptional regulator [Clostridiaceae bacterium]|nr:transcriptional regulator [Clostridiaceae bacterium]